MWCTLAWHGGGPRRPRPQAQADRRGYPGVAAASAVVCPASSPDGRCGASPKGGWTTGQPPCHHSRMPHQRALSWTAGTVPGRGYHTAPRSGHREATGREVPMVRASMSRQLLAGLAALALVVGAGSALAQPGPDQPTATAMPTTAATATATATPTATPTATVTATAAATPTAATARETAPVTAPATATPGELRPGWGCGDRNHVHTGPPGNPSATSPCPAQLLPASTPTASPTPIPPATPGASPTPVTPTATTLGGAATPPAARRAVPAAETRPGNGGGDDHHAHSGPPGGAGNHDGTPGRGKDAASGR